ncbi:MAG: hypothetical protein AW09_000440 [Candidatus Accumulibacter phosphatis]|uniref:Uncharacterized protein n=1 Tax=Candidatus Accumulibacter phosphatis TaxID=327160 RepID=A0A080LZE9_9PROT|nr:MAG: hypothetical protein AW09_000440 [Candidatus Accumulibacter phosphatis]
MLRQCAVRNVPLQVADQVGNQHLGRSTAWLRMPGQRFDQVKGENAHVAVGTQVGVFAGLARTEHGAPGATGEATGSQRFGFGPEERRRNRRAGEWRRRRLLDRHAGRVTAIENDEQAARRQLRDGVGKVGGADRAAAHPPQVEVVGDQVVFVALDVAVAAEVEDGCRVAVRNRRESVGQPVERVEYPLPAALGAGQQAKLFRRVAAARRMHQDIAQGARVGGHGRQGGSGFLVLVHGDQQRTGVLEAVAHVVSWFGSRGQETRSRASPGADYRTRDRLLRSVKWTRRALTTAAGSASGRQSTRRRSDDFIASPGLRRTCAWPGAGRRGECASFDRRHKSSGASSASHAHAHEFVEIDAP